MTSQRQIDANRLNALKSTGPRSPEGKARSAMNALKSGIDAYASIIPGEDPDSLAELAALYQERYSPQSPEEAFFVDILVQNHWQRRRFAKVDSQLWNGEIAHSPNSTPRDVLGNAFKSASDHFVRLRRNIDASERSFKAALHELERLQAARPAPEPPAEAIDSVESKDQMGSFPQPAASPLKKSPLPSPGPRPPDPGPDPNPSPRPPVPAFPLDSAFQTEKSDSPPKNL